MEEDERISNEFWNLLTIYYNSLLLKVEGQVYDNHLYKRINILWENEVIPRLPAQPKISVGLILKESRTKTERINPTSLWS